MVNCAFFKKNTTQALNFAVKIVDLPLLETLDEIHIDYKFAFYLPGKQKLLLAI